MSDRQETVSGLQVILWVLGILIIVGAAFAGAEVLFPAFMRQQMVSGYPMRESSIFLSLLAVLWGVCAMFLRSIRRSG